MTRSRQTNQELPIPNFVNFLPISCALIAIVAGAHRFRDFDLPSKILWLKTCAGFLADGIAMLAAIRYGNNMPVYSIYSLIDFVLTAAYFNYTVDVLRRTHIGMYVGGIGVVCWLLNTIFLQPLGTLSSYYMYFQGIVAIGLSFFYFFRLLLSSEDLRLGRLRHFWFSVLICLFWTITFFNWGLYNYFLVNERQWMWLINRSILAVSSINYLAIATIFLLYRRLKPNNE